MQIDIRHISFATPDHDAEIALRSKILREPLGLTFSREDLARESSDIHVGAFASGNLLGCLLLSPQNGGVIKMRQVAVAHEAQGSGIGKKLVFYAEALSVEKGFEQMILNARETAVPFYLALGYEVYDEPFVEVTIPHRKMKKSLA